MLAAGIALLAASAFSAPPSGMMPVSGGVNIGTDPDFGSYSLSVDSFFMDETEVTLAKWNEVLLWAESNGYEFTGNAGVIARGVATNHPVQGVNWYNVVKWCNARSEMEGYTPCYTVGGSVYRQGWTVPECDFAATNTYRLPTEEEWEYAARGGVSDTRFYWGDTISHTQANYFSSTDYAYDISSTRGFHPTYNRSNPNYPFTSPVKSFSTNAYGLYDMVGNVSEWCWDVSDTWAHGIKGGSWDYHAPNQSLACRREYTPLNEFPEIGFRTLFASTDIEPILSILTSQGAISVPEGGTNTFTVRLSINPETPRTVTVSRVSGGDTDLSVLSGASLAFNSTSWSNEQTVTIGAAEDADWADSNALFRCASPDMIDVDVTATEDDDETNPDYALPWSETFESSGEFAGGLGSLDGQHGWVAETGAIVTNADPQAGLQSLAMTEATASHTFEGAPENIQIHFWAKPVRGANLGGIPDDAAAVFFVNTNGLLVAYDSTNATLTETTVSNVWNKFSVECDYVSNVWNLELNDELVVSNFAFCSAPAAFQTLQIVEYSSTPSYIDEISVTDAQGTPDTDSDGLPDWWETQYYGGATNAIPGATASNGVNTILETYIAGLDPTDPNAAFLISDLTALTSGPVLGWNATSGRVYAIYWTSNLLSGFGAPWKTNLTGAAYTDTTHSATDKGFYKIEVQVE